MNSDAMTRQKQKSQTARRTNPSVSELWDWEYFKFINFPEVHLDPSDFCVRCKLSLLQHFRSYYKVTEKWLQLAIVGKLYLQKVQVLKHSSAHSGEPEHY
jgi:hypothetical protein